MQQIIYKFLQLQDYLVTLDAMKQFTKKRNVTTIDEIWFVEHPSVFTLGLGGLEHHILNAGNIPVVKTDRGGQVTYHGPGQLIIYFLIDLIRRSLSVKQLIYIMQQAIIELLHDKYNIHANTKPNAPGVFILEEKICSIGLKISKGCSYHGLSLNVDMNLESFNQINPCGFKNLKMTQLSNINKTGKIYIHSVAEQLKDIFINKFDNLGYSY